MPRFSNVQVLGVILVSALFVNFAGDVWASLRANKLGPVCARDGWVIIETGWLQSPKCLDTQTGLVHYPPDFVQLIH